MFFSSQPWALGFGEIKLHSRVGESLNAEVPIYGDASDEITTTCFSLADIRNEELPVVTSARTRLVRAGQSFHLLITSSYPISEPVFMIGLRADCGIDLQRNYVLMPAAPLPSEEPRLQLAVTATDRSPARKPANFLKWSAQDGDTLESIAASRAQDSGAEKSRLLTAIQRANPDLRLGQHLAKGTFVRIPNLVQSVARKQELPLETNAKPPYPQTTDAPTAPKSKKHLRDASPSKRSDRVLLSSAPEVSELGQPSQDSPNTLDKMEDRMLKLETTLHTLNLQLEKLNAVLEVTGEAAELRQKIQSARPHDNATNAMAATTPTPPPPDNAGTVSWLELLLSALAGGAISAGIAQMLSRRHPYKFENQLAAQALRGGR